MTVLAVVAIVLGSLPILAGAVFLFRADSEAFLFAIGVTTIVCIGTGALAWGISYLAGAS